MDQCLQPVSLRGLEQRSEVLSRTQLGVIALLVVALHVFCLVGLWHLMRPTQNQAESDAMTVVWLPATAKTPLPLPAMPVPPQRAAPVNAPRAQAAVAPAEISGKNVQTESDVAVPLDRSTWLMPDGSLRRDHGTAELPTWTDQDRITLSRVTRLPGSTDAAAAEKVAIRLRKAMTPEDVVNAVLRFLFGQVNKDDCQAIERRLYLSDPGVSREIDMIKYRKTCTP